MLSLQTDEPQASQSTSRNSRPGRVVLPARDRHALDAPHRHGLDRASIGLLQRQCLPGQDS